MNNNCQNPNFDPDFEWFEKRAGGSGENSKSGENTTFNKAARKIIATWAAKKRKSSGDLLRQPPLK
eukprot:13266863-Ditylum_brightwellii.AAC.1